MAERKPKDKRKDKDTTEFDNFQRMLEQVLSVPKEEIDKRRKEWDKERRERAG